MKLINIFNMSLIVVALCLFGWVGLTLSDKLE